MYKPKYIHTDTHDAWIAEHACRQHSLGIFPALRAGGGIYLTNCIQWVRRMENRRTGVEMDQSIVDVCWHFSLPSWPSFFLLLSSFFLSLSLFSLFHPSFFFRSLFSSVPRSYFISLLSSFLFFSVDRFLVFSLTTTVFSFSSFLFLSLLAETNTPSLSFNPIFRSLSFSHSHSRSHFYPPI